MADRDDELIVPVNTRSPEMWRMIAPSVNWLGARVLDLGCGEGDMLIHCAQAGVKEIWGIDHDWEVLQSAINRTVKYPSVYTVRYDALGWLDMIRRDYRVILCLSTLPYLGVRMGLEAIRAHCKVAIVECQYDGDGPGPAFLKDDDDMQELLSQTGFGHVTRLGHTHIEGRNTNRTIWRAE